MLFSGIPFLYYFLPIVLLLYFLTPKNLKNLFLLIASLVFYGWGEPRYIVIMLISVTAGYISGILIEKYRNSKRGRLILCLSLFIPLSFLLYFKYTDFFISNFNRATGLSVPLLNIALPIGISFYTFQIVSYQIDVYRGTAALRNPVNLATYISLFPQLIAGPIVRYQNIEKQLTDRTHTLSRSAEGVLRFAVGLGKKVLLANTLGTLCNAFTSSEPTVLFSWINCIAMTMQIYFDFSGYSDMAIGLGKILGFDFMENFNYPFISSSISEFWRRWHISLGSWLRDYVYIPLGGNRVSVPRHIVNIFIVWFITGFWHGADWNFIIWGLFYGVLLICEKFFIGKHLEKSRVLSHIYVLFFTLISFTIFNSTSLESIALSLSQMAGLEGIPFINAEAVYYLKSYGVLLTAAVIGCTPLPKKLSLSVNEKFRNILEPVFVIAVFLLSTAYLVDGSFNPFLYFRF